MLVNSYCLSSVRIDESEANEGESPTADGSVEKPQLEPPQLAEVDEKDINQRGLRLLFGVQKSHQDALKIEPVQNRDARALDMCLARLATLKEYSYLTMVHADANEAGELLEESVAKTCFNILSDVAKKGLLAQSVTKDSSDLLKLARTSKSKIY